MKAMKFVERHAALICCLCVATGALIVIKGAFIA